MAAGRLTFRSDRQFTAWLVFEVILGLVLVAGALLTSAGPAAVRHLSGTTAVFVGLDLVFLISTLGGLVLA
jgi:hypothetical protein